MSTPTCSNCHRPLDKGAAKGLDSRCYQYKRRTGRLPPVELLQGEELEERVTVRLNGELLRQVRRLAKRDGVGPATWLRHAAQERVLREAAIERWLL